MRALQVAVAAVRPTQGREALWKLGLDSIDGEAAGDVAVTATVPELPGLPALRDASARRVAVDVRLPRQAAPARSVRAAAAHRLLVRRRARPRPRRAAHVPRRPHRGRRSAIGGRRRRSSGPPVSTCGRRSPSTPRSSAPTVADAVAACASMPSGRAASCASSGAERVVATHRRRCRRRRRAVRQHPGVPVVGARAARPRRGAVAAGRATPSVVDWLRLDGATSMTSGGGRRTAEERLQPAARDAAVADGARRGAAGRRRPPLRAHVEQRWRTTSSWRRCAGCRRSSTR